MPTLDLNDPLLSRNEMAALLRVTRSFLDHAALKGNGPPFFRLGRAIRYDRNVVENWLAEQTYQPPATAA